MASLSDFEGFDPADFENPNMDQAIPKGNKTMYMLLADSVTAGQMMIPPMPSAESGWTLVEDLAAAGWVEDARVHEPDHQFRYEDDMQEMAPFLASIGFHSTFRDVFNPNLGDNSFITHRHTIKDTGFPAKKLSDYFDEQGNFIGEEPWFIDEAIDTSSPFDSVLESVICPAAGLIVAFDNLSPSSHKGVEHYSDQIPCVKHWSDIAFLQWAMRTELQFDLKFVLQYNVLNEPTLAVVDEIVSLDLQLEWPGVTFDTRSLEGQALIGTPNGVGVAYLLIQHKRKLGHKMISAVTIFHPKGYSWVLLFHIVDVVSPQIGVGEAQQAGIDANVVGLGGRAIE